jgi:hypothetical protein
VGKKYNGGSGKAARRAPRRSKLQRGRRAAATTDREKMRRVMQTVKNGDRNTQRHEGQQRQRKWQEAEGAMKETEKKKGKTSKK